jgi:hypothetical protein
LAITPTKESTMHMKEIRVRAKALGLTRIGRIRKADLIRKIQQAENHSPCFGSEQRLICPQEDCCWRQDCLGGKPA